MPNSKTFTIKPIKELIAVVINKFNGQPSTIIDMFANDMSIKTNVVDKFSNIKYISNDLDTQYPTDYHLDAIEFIKNFDDSSIDLVLFDPPYSPRQVSEEYKKLGKTVTASDTSSAYWGNLKKEIARVVKKDGRVITCGWNSGGIGKTNGFEIEEILLVPHGGNHNDTIIVVDKKIK